MQTYEVRLTAEARRDLRALPRRMRERAAAVITALGDNARPPGCKKLAGADDVWRLRFGNYRVVYQIVDARLVVLVVKIGHRKDVYR